MTITVGAVIVWLAPGSQKQRPLFILQHFLRFRSSKLDPQVFEGKKGLWKFSQKYSGGCLKTFLVLKLGTNIKYLVLSELQRVNIFNKEWGLVGVWACDLGQRAILKTVLFQPLWPCPVEGHEAEISHGTIKAFYLFTFLSASASCSMWQRAMPRLNKRTYLLFTFWSHPSSTLSRCCLIMS